MRNHFCGAIGLTACAAIVIGGALVAAQTPRNVSDLVGARAVSGEAQLKARGYRLKNSVTTGGRKFTAWWSPVRKHCILVETADGRYSSIRSAPDSDCNKSDNTEPAGSQAPRDVRDLVDARASSGETQLRARGYRLKGGVTTGGRKFTAWWSPVRKQCILVETVDGRYATINSAPDSDCNKGDNTDTAGSQSQAPRDVRDLVDARASSGETQLRARGYALSRTKTAEDRKWNYWWNSARKQCILVEVFDGRYASIASTGAFDCNQ